MEYAEIARALAPSVDVLLCETMSSTGEAAAAATAAAATGRPVWVSLTLEDAGAATEPHLRSGESLDQAMDVLAGIPGLAAVLVNCTCPGAVCAAIPVLRRLAPASVLVGGYANGFLQTTGEWLAGAQGQAINDPSEYDSTGTILPMAYAAHAAKWVFSGAGVVGGCCGVGPEHIVEVARRLAGPELR